jgi:chitodextrinase
MTTTNRSNSAPAWQPNQIYVAGDLVTIGSLTYLANWWTQSDPAISSGSSGSGLPWTLVSPTVPPSGGTGAPSWLVGSVYTAGMTVVMNGVTYKANWWTQGNDPTGSSGPLGSGQPWTIVTSPPPPPPAPPPAVPTVPTGLAASQTSANSTLLTWQPSTVPGNGAVSGYAVFENGAQIATTTGTTYTATNLAAGTAFNFAVAALDSAGSSALSAPLSFTTSAGSTNSTWLAGSVYIAGMTVVVDGVTYHANWWTQGNDPASNSGPVGSGQPWTRLTPAGPVSSVPSVPAGLTAYGTTSSSTTLSWQASAVPGNGTVTDYAIFENGQQIATTTGTAFTVGNLTAANSYRFAVAAEDSAGSSAQTAPVSVTTMAVGSGGGTTTQVFAPYIDMGLLQDQDLLAISQASGIKTFTLAFLQSSGPGTVGWSGVGTIANDTLQNGTSILYQVQRLEAAGGSVIISFGGSAGIDPAAAATSAQVLQAEYQSVIDRYGVSSLDFDIEGAEVADQRAITLRDQALVGLKAANPNLSISFTLPVLPSGLDSNGLTVLQSAKHDGLNPDVVNVMAMDYGASVDQGGQMGADAINAALKTIDQIRFVGLTSKVGVTPMIGVNDISSEVFTLADARDLLNFAKGNSDIARLAMWSVARDNGSQAGAHYAAPDASGIAQSAYQFASIFKDV